jgi:hypothetical protein
MFRGIEVVLDGHVKMLETTPLLLTNCSEQLTDFQLFPVQSIVIWARSVS